MEKNNWEIPICCLCHSDKQKILWSDITYWEYKGFFSIVKCLNCELVFLSPRPKITEISTYYEQENYFGRNIRDYTIKYDDKKEREFAYGKIYSIIFSNKKSGNILDIGAGTGLFLSKLKDEKWDVKGVELMRDAVKYCMDKYGIKLFQGDFFAAKFRENSFDVITLNGALEHLHKPQEALQKAHSLLKKGGMIIFSVPNVTSLGNFIFGKNWFPWQPPRHLYHFSPITAAKMLVNAKFNDIHVNHDYWLQNQYILFQSLRYSKSPKFQKSKLGGLLHKDQKNKFSIKKELGKIIGTIFSYTIAYIEPFIKKGEVIIVYAKK